MTELIKFSKVRYCYGSVCAVRNIDLAVCEKTLTALVGPNGGGKTTLIRLLSGLMRPDEGTIERRPGVTVGYVAQAHSFDTTFPVTVREMVLMGTLSRGAKPFFRYGEAQIYAVQEALRRVRLEGYEHRGVGQLSGGQLRRAVIARALASDAEVIVLDEPDAGLDMDALRELYAVLGELKADRTIVISSHSIGEVLSIADSAYYVNKTAKEYSSPLRLKEELEGGMEL